MQVTVAVPSHLPAPGVLQEGPVPRHSTTPEGSSMQRCPVEHGETSLTPRTHEMRELPLHEYVSPGAHAAEPHIPPMLVSKQSSPKTLQFAAKVPSLPVRFATITVPAHTGKRPGVTPLPSSHARTASHVVFAGASSAQAS